MFDARRPRDGRGTLLARWDELITRPHGILLATGPTGSGKSTTLYASLDARIVSDEIKVDHGRGSRSSTTSTA